MKLLNLKLIVFLILVIIQSASGAYALNDASLYQYAQQEVKEGDLDFAFLHYNAILKYSTFSKYYKEALFATGEYYFLNNNYTKAQEAFSAYIEHYPKDDGLLFAIVYLLKMEQSFFESSYAVDLKKQVITYKQLSLLFSEFKEFSYESPLALTYKALYFIDKAEIYIDGKLFEKVYF